MSSRRGRYGRLIYLNNNDEESLPDYFKTGIDFLFKYRVIGSVNMSNLQQLFRQT